MSAPSLLPKQQPWLLFEPDGTFDGLIWSPRSLEEAQRKLARPRRWATLAREGWTVRPGVADEHVQLIADRIALQRERNGASA